jgi:N-acetylglutamate synthase-like GNAT family acetyltransferase
VAGGPSAEQLRAMAEHRGMKLLRSRKRTPGVGDYGRYGLTDADGKALLGIGKEGLTATSRAIEDFLRGSALSTWKMSAETTPDAKPPKTKKKPASEDNADDDGPVRRKAKTASSPRRAPSSPRGSAPPPREKRPRPSTPVLRIVSNEDPEKAPARPLQIRAAKAADAPGVAKLLGQLAGPKQDAGQVAENIASLRKAKGQLVVAERGAIVGCCAWTVVPTIQRGPVGRVTLLLVDKEHRREGIATAMVDAAAAALATRGCREVEAMSAIMVNNAHNFFRSSKFEQKSYRFVRPIFAD